MDYLDWLSTVELDGVDAPGCDRLSGDALQASATWKGVRTAQLAVLVVGPRIDDEMCSVADAIPGGLRRLVIRADTPVSGSLSFSGPTREVGLSALEQLPEIWAQTR